MSTTTTISPTLKTSTKKTPSEEDVFTKDDFLNALRKVSLKKVPAKPAAKSSEKKRAKRPLREKRKTSE